MFDKRQFRSLVDRVTTEIGLYHPAATNLILGTAAQESRFGTYLRQIGGGPALGVFQVEPETESSIWHDYIVYRQSMIDSMLNILGLLGPDPLRLEGDLIYQIALCRIQYRRKPEPLPDEIDIEGLGRYWKTWWNTEAGKGTVKEFIDNYIRFVQ